jgi:hypothetical protein
MGPQDSPGYWLVTGARLDVDNGRGGSRCTSSFPCLPRLPDRPFIHAEVYSFLMLKTNNTSCLHFCFRPFFHVSIIPFSLECPWMLVLGECNFFLKKKEKGECNNYREMCHFTLGN